MQENRFERLGFMLKGIYDGLLGRKGAYNKHWQEK
jgi:rhamnosyltransferase